MIRPLTLVTLLLAAGSGAYLFAVKHRAQVLDDQLANVAQQSRVDEQHIRVLQAQWALETDPTRLAQLAGQFTGLQPMKPAQLVTLASLADSLPPAGKTAPGPNPEPSMPDAVAGAASPAALAVASAAAPASAPVSAPALSPASTPVSKPAPAMVAAAAPAPTAAPAPAAAAPKSTSVLAAANNHAAAVPTDAMIQAMQHPKPVVAAHPPRPAPTRLAAAKPAMRPAAIRPASRPPGIKFAENLPPPVAVGVAALPPSLHFNSPYTHRPVHQAVAGGSSNGGSGGGSGGGSALALAADLPPPRPLGLGETSN